MRYDEILVAVPTRGAIQWATVTRLQEVRDACHGLPPIIYQPGNLSVAQTRNRIVKRFLAGDWRALAMVDDDVVPSPHFLEMRCLLDDYAMLCQPHPFPLPHDPSRLALGAFDLAPLGLVRADLGDGVTEVDAVATGCVIIAREPLVELGPAPFRIADDPDAPEVSDDFLFCRDLRAAGHRIGAWVDHGWFADHHATVSLAPLIEHNLEVTTL
jgi:hypothetical protein